MDKKKNGIPKLRFPGFTGAWEQRKLGDISKTKRGLTYKPFNIDNTGIRVLRSSNIKEDTFVISDDDVFVKESAVNIPFVENGDILITAANGSTNLVGKHAIIRDIPKNSAVHGGFMLITTSKEYEFLNALMSSNWYKKFIKKYVAGGNGAIGNLRKNDLDNQKIYVPKKDEQEKIGNFFKMLDSLITLHQRKLDHLKEQKKGLLQKMFPKKGEVVPEVRFPGFTNAWEQRKLGEVGKTQSGIGFPNQEQGGHQGIPFFKVSDMNNEGNEFEMKISNNYVTEIQITNRKWKPISEVPAVIFAKVGAALMLNRKRLVKVPFLIDNNTMAYIFNKKWDPYFGKTLFDTLNLPRYAQIGALPSFNGSDIENIKAMLPSLEEQQVLSQFFQNIDTLIALHQRKLDHLKLLKKGLLQQMFV